MNIRPQAQINSVRTWCRRQRAHTRAALIAAVSLTLLPGLIVAAEEKAEEKKLPVIELTEKPAFPFEKHLEQKELIDGSWTNEKIFEAGGDLFHTTYNGLDGVGQMRTLGGTPVSRFSNGPAGGGQPIAITSQRCGSCHGSPFAAAAGDAHTRVFLDPDGDGQPPFSVRATTSLWGNGILQLLAQEMTEELHAARDSAAEAARAQPGTAVRRDLAAKGIDYGAISATADAAGEVTFDLSAVQGVSADLVVRPFGWKGHIVTVRNFDMAAANFGFGMQAEEFVWRLPAEAQPDPDGDGVEREFSVGDITAMTIYTSAQETPQSVARLAELGMITPPSAEDMARVQHGEAVFTRVGCASCHRPELQLSNTVFEEPTERGNGQFMDAFLAGKDADYDPKRPVRIDLLTEAQPPRLEANPDGGAVVRLYGDLKRHRMGRLLADFGGPQAPLTAVLQPLKIGEEIQLIQPSEFLTPELWGVGSTGPYLHDDRAGSLREAITFHGEDSPPAVGDPGRSEAQESRDAFVALSSEEQNALISFLKSLVTFSPES